MEVRKGCALKDAFRNDENTVLDHRRKCFTSRMTSIKMNRGNLTMSTKEFTEKMDFSKLEHTTMAEQYESCYCFGSFCNSAPMFATWMPTIVLMSMLFHFVH